MKRGWLVMVLGAAAMMGVAGCDEKKRAAYYDPELDGVMPHGDKSAELSILENQQRLYAAFLQAGGGGPKTPAAAPAPAPAAAPGAAPAAAPAEGAAPATPGPETPPAPAPPSEETPATPAPPPPGEGTAPPPPST